MGFSTVVGRVIDGGVEEHGEKSWHVARLEQAASTSKAGHDKVAKVNRKRRKTMAPTSFVALRWTIGAGLGRAVSRHCRRMSLRVRP